MDTSKTSSIKSLLLQAWRERWTDVQWGIYIKGLLPRGVSGDVYDLADCILQQALVGPGPNTLFLSYLTHSLSAHVVSYGAVLSSIGRYQSFYKPHCILSLLNLLKNIQHRVGCRGNEEECIALCKAVVSITHWLYSCVLHSLVKIVELKQSPEHVSIMEKACEILAFFWNSELIKALLYVGRFEDPNVYAQLLQKHQELESRVNQSLTVSKELYEKALSLVSSIDKLPYSATQLNVFGSTNDTQFVCAINAVIAIDAILNPASGIQVCVDQLLLMKKLQNLSTPDLYCEILRACFMGLADAASSNEDLKWAAFTFLKVPQLLAKINKALSNNDQSSDYSYELEQGLEKLMYFVPLLDLTDVKSNCDCLQFLLKELSKVDLLSESQIQKLLSRRQSDTKRQNVVRTDQQSGQASANLILRAEPTVTSILKTLDSDYSKNQEALLGVLCHMIPGKSFELILSAANATGKLQNFATKLIRFNEYNKQMAGESVKASQTRALLFDITFLMLCHIAQHYGIETVCSSPETRESFFATWVTECLAEGGKYKSPDTMLAHCDPAKVEILLTQFTNPEPEFKTSVVKWHDMCINVPLAIREILLAWEYGALSIDNVKIILDNVKGRMCCLPVCISAWLCNYINMLHHEERLKPMNMIQQFMTPLSAETTPSVSTESGPASVGSQQGSEPINSYYKERSTLMASIIKKMFYDLHPPSQSKAKSVPIISHGLTVKTPLWDIMEGIFNTGHSQGWLDLKTTHSLDTLLCVGGPIWFCDTLVRMALKFEHLNDLQRAIDFVFGVFHIDIEQCALAMLNHILPGYLMHESRQEMLLEPRGSALARLMVLTIYGALQAKQTATALGMQRTGRKRSYREIDLEEDTNWSGFDRGGRATKLRRGETEIFDDTPFGIQSGSSESLRSIASEPLNRAIADIMRMLMVIALDPNISQRTMFPVLFLEQITLCAKEHAQTVLQFMPLGLGLQLIKCLPDAFTYDLILATSNLQTARARKITARALCQLDVHHRPNVNV